MLIMLIMLIICEGKKIFCLFSSTELEIFEPWNLKSLNLEIEIFESLEPIRDCVKSLTVTGDTLERVYVFEYLGCCIESIPHLNDHID